MRAVAADDEGSLERRYCAHFVQGYVDVVVTLLGRNKFGIVFNAPALALQLVDEESLCNVLRHHRDEGIRGILRDRSVYERGRARAPSRLPR